MNVLRSIVKLHRGEKITLHTDTPQKKGGRSQETHFLLCACLDQASSHSLCCTLRLRKPWCFNNDAAGQLLAIVFGQEVHKTAHGGHSTDRSGCSGGCTSLLRFFFLKQLSSATGSVFLVPQLAHESDDIGNRNGAGVTYLLNEVLSRRTLLGHVK